MPQRRLILGHIVAVATFSAALTEIAIAQDNLAWKVGDEWTYAKFDRKSRGEPSVVEKRIISRTDEAFLTTYKEGDAVAEEIVTLDGTHARNAVDTIRGFKHVPIQFPLTSETRWSTGSLFAPATGALPWSSRSSCAVSGSDHITVPAGSFDTIRIVCKGYWNSTGGYSGALDMSGWYSPMVKWFVKFQVTRGSPPNSVFNHPEIELRDEYLLTSYKVAP